MSDSTTPRWLFVGVANTTSVHPDVKPLDRALDDVRELADRFEELGLEAVCVADPANGYAAGERLRRELPHASLAARGVLVLLWAGHAAPNNRTNVLALLTAGDENAIGVTMEPATLADIAASSSASQVLILLDTCHSGGGAIEALAVSSSAASEHAKQDGRWTGILASCQAHERARDGALVSKLLALLRDGPRDWRLRLRWSAYQADLRGDDLVDAVLTEWDEERHAPVWLQSGSAQPVMRNPLYSAGLQDQVVEEHLLWSARGGAQSEAGNWFTGREAQLSSIISWLRPGEPGLCVVTGPAGCGKSAVAGRVVSLSNPVERGEIMNTTGLPDDRLDPGENAVGAHVQARGMDIATFARVLAEQLGVIAMRGDPSHHDVLGWVEKERSPPVVVVDGLDEAGVEAERIATELLAPLTAYALVLVASRDAPASEEGKTLLGLLGTPARRLDLGEDPDGTDADIDAYVHARLRDVERAPASGRMDPGAVAARITELVAQSGGRRREGGFLLARVLTSQLRERPLDTTLEGWEEGLAGSLEDALFEDLDLARPLIRDATAVEGAGRDLLGALAYSYGPGLPADDVWPAIATALSDAGTVYDRDDAFWALEQYRRYITVSSIGGQPVYRLHQQLAEALRRDRGGDQDTLAARIAASALDVYAQFLQTGRGATEHPYLWRYGWRHAVDAQAIGIEMLQRLAERDGALVPDVAHALSALGAFYSGVGRRADAVAPTERAVDIREGLAAENAAFRNDLAGSLNNLGICYSEVGRRADAVAPTERAVELYEGLAAENAAFRNDLAGSLNNLGICYGEVGRRADAVAPTERAVELYEGLAAENAAFRNDLAGSLNNLGICYSEVGRRADAVAPTERAVELYEGLAAENAAFRNDLAGSLNNLGICYGEVGRRADAVAPTERAVELYEGLAAENAAFRNDLAASLNNLGICYSEVGRRADAVAPTERAVELYEGLAAENAAFRNDLAGSLNNLGICYSEVGRRADAVAPTERAVELYEGLAAENAAFRNDLAGSLNNLGIRYSEVGRRADAVAPTERAVELYEGLAAENAAFRNDLAGSLNNLGIRYSEVGRRADAVAPTERAVELYEGLAAENAAFRNDLAGSLNNLGIRYSEVGRRADAVAPTERAVELYEGLAAENAAFRNDLAGSLNNLGNRYSEVGRRADAVAPTERAVELREGLAAENAAFRNDLAASLNNLGNRYSEVGRRADAVAPTERAVELYEGLAAENAAFRNDLAGSLNNLGNRYSEVGRRADAVAPTERAVELYEGLAAENAAFRNDLAASLNNLGTRYSEVGRRAERDDRWTTVLERFAENPTAAIILRLARTRDDDEYDDAIDDLLEAHAMDAGEDAQLTAQLHAKARALRKQDPKRFDSRWSDTADQLPAWLLLDEDTLELAMSWIDAPTWAQSRDLLTANAGQLLAGPGETALAELALATRGADTISHHQEILKAAREHGIDSIYGPLLILDTVDAWLEIDELHASKTFLADHHDDLTTPEALDVLARRGKLIHNALAALARSGQTDRGYALVQTPDQLPEALATARQTTTPRSLQAIAQLALATARTDDEQANAITHLAIARVLTDNGQQATELIGQIRQADVNTTPLIQTLTDTIAHHPDQAPALAALIGQLNSTN